MREIKFRVVWNKEVSNEAFTIGEFVEGVEMSFKDGGTLPFKDIDWQTDTVEYIQYTGIKDKNGKEIYEGDLFNCMYHRDGHTDHVYEVVYNDESTCFVLRRHGGVCPQTQVRQRVNDHSGWSGEIIGNIYENPELLCQ